MSPPDAAPEPRPPAKQEPAEADKASKDRPLIVYAYAESAPARENLQYFLARGLHGAADFVFVFNGETNATSLVPDMPHIRVVKRSNTCYDLGAIGEVLRADDLWRRYRRFITLNASIRGPFRPMWSSACWSDVYLSKVTDATKVEISGA